eukprot:6825886-Karenia_brevis.AAC.1
MDQVERCLCDSGTVSRARFDDINMDCLRKPMDQVEICLRDCGIDMRGAHEVVFMGGSSCIPKAQSMVRDSSNGKERCNQRALRRLRTQ